MKEICRGLNRAKDVKHLRGGSDKDMEKNQSVEERVRARLSEKEPISRARL